MKTIIFAGKQFVVNYKKQQFESAKDDNVKPIDFSYFKDAKNGFFYIFLHPQLFYPVKPDFPGAVQINVFSETFLDETKLHFFGK